MNCRLPLLLALLFTFTSTPLLAEDWPCWRGPRLDGSSLETNPPLRWSATDNIAWKTPIPGIGHSSPILHGQRVFVTTCLEKEKQRVLLCLDRANGKILWQRVVVTAPLERKHKLNSFASSTPATDGRHVFVAFLEQPKMQVYCYDFDGNLVWQKTAGKFNSPHGFCSPPILYKDTLIVNGDQDGDGFLVALEKATGAERWRTPRPNKTRSYCAPLIVQAAGKVQMVLSGSKCVAGYDPGTGKQLWIIDGPTEQYCASLVYGDGLFFLTTGFPKFHNLAIRPDGSGNVTKSHVVWHENDVPARKASYVPSPIAHDQWFFMISDLGGFVCFEAKTGKRLWEKQLGSHHSASPVYAAGHLFLTDDDGVTYVLKAGPKFELVSRNALEDECYASPAVSNGQIFLRTQHYLFCIGTRTSR